MSINIGASNADDAFYRCGVEGGLLSALRVLTWRRPGTHACTRMHTQAHARAHTHTLSPTPDHLRRYKMPKLVAKVGPFSVYPVVLWR